MKRSILVFLLVLALATVSGVGLVAAQESTMLRAFVVDDTMLYAEPSEAAEVVAELSGGAVLDMLATDETGAWLEVAGDAGTGYVMLDSVVVLDLSMLAPKVYVSTDEAGATSLFALPDVAAELVASLPDGTGASVLAVNGEFAYVDTPLGQGWSVVTDWETVSGEMQSVSTEMLAGGVAAYDAPKLNADPVAILMPGQSVYMVEEVDESYSSVFVPGMGLVYVQSKNLGDPSGAGLYVEVATDMLAGGVALYDAPKLNADPVVVVPPGSVLMWVENVDSTYDKVYIPTYGEVYVQSKNLGNPFSVATVQVAEAVVRAGPNDNVYGAVALLRAGTPVIVKGVSETGAWIEVAIPFDELDFGYNGVSGWMRDFLFVDGMGESDLAADMLAVTE